jgi:small subunit ribosomal protein S9
MAEEIKEEKNIKPAQKAEKRDYVLSIGRRREAIARVRMYETIKDGLVWGEHSVKKGDIIVNEIPAAIYFAGETMRYLYTEPIRVANAQNKYTFTIRVTGGGKSGQLAAAVHGMAQALSEVDPSYRDILKKKGFITRDSRTRERRKVGTGGKARRAKQSPKR